MVEEDRAAAADLVAGGVRSALIQLRRPSGGNTVGVKQSVFNPTTIRGGGADRRRSRLLENASELATMPK